MIREKFLAALPQPECIRCHCKMTLGNQSPWKALMLSLRWAFAYCLKCEAVRRERY